MEHKKQILAFQLWTADWNNIIFKPQEASDY